MAILKIARMGHPVLMRRAAEVADPTAPELRRLVADMHETMVDAGGTGIAAPQVHVPQRVVMFFVGEGRAAAADGEEGDGPVPLTVLVNPTFAPLGEEAASGWEGCLSVPGLRGLVPRYTHIRYGGTTPEGERIEREARGFHARVVQHELDHLDGVLYPQRMPDLRWLIFESEARHLAARAAEADEGEDAV